MEHEWSMSARHRAQLRFWNERPLTCDSSLPQAFHYIYRIQNILGNQTKVKFEFEEIDFRSNNWFFVQFPQNQLFALIAVVFSRTEALQYAKVHTWKRFRDSYEMLKGIAMLSDVLSAEILIGCYPLVLCPRPLSDVLPVSTVTIQIQRFSRAFVNMRRSRHINANKNTHNLFLGSDTFVSAWPRYNLSLS